MQLHRRKKLSPEQREACLLTGHLLKVSNVFHIGNGNSENDGMKGNKA